MAEGGEVTDESLFDLSKKKKKKKPKEETNEAEENVSKEASSTVDQEKKSKNVVFAEDKSSNRENIKAEGGEEQEDDVLGRKKKRKAKGPTASGATTEVEKKLNEQDENAENTETDGSVFKEHTYDELLSRVSRLIREGNPSGGDNIDRIKLIIKPPQIARIGTKRTSFTNFGEICKSLKRQERHLYQYLLAELGTNGSIDANSAFIIKGRFQQKQIENVLRTYIKEYVICKTCRSADSTLQKEERMMFLFCNTCQSRYSVIGIKTGFQAQVGRRAATRAKVT